MDPTPHSDEPSNSTRNKVLPGVVVITGASRGLGAGIAARLARQGVRLGLCARTRPQTSPDAPPSVREVVDVADPDAVARFAARVTSELGPIDLWINNAGVLAPIGPLRDAPVTELATNIEINLLGVIWGSRVFARHVHDRVEPGVLVNVTSGAARSPYEGWAAYCATKAGVDQVSRVLAAEENRHGLSVFAVAPGLVDTDMQRSIRATPPERFPGVGRFIGIAETGSFTSSEWVADRVLDLYSSQHNGALPGWTNAGDDAVVVRIPDEPRG